MHRDIQRAWKIIGRLNALAPGDFDAVRALLGELTGHELDPSVRVLPPFHTDGGRNLRFGRNVFVNHGCTAMDLGGIDIGDDVMIGPNVHLISSGHPLDPAIRRSQITTAPIRIGRGVWIAAGAMVLQGVTVGDDAVVAAGAVVTKDVPPRTLVAGVPQPAAAPGDPVDAAVELPHEPDEPARRQSRPPLGGSTTASLCDARACAGALIALLFRSRASV